MGLCAGKSAGHLQSYWLVNFVREQGEAAFSLPIFKQGPVFEIIFAGRADSRPDFFTLNFSAMLLEIVLATALAQAPAMQPKPKPTPPVAVVVIRGKSPIPSPSKTAKVWHAPTAPKG